MFVIDPERQSPCLSLADKQGDRRGWYEESITLAEERFKKWLAEWVPGRDRTVMRMTARSWRAVRSEAITAGKLGQERLAEDTTRLLNEVVAQRLTEMREQAGLSQRAVAERMGVSQARVSEIERGELDRTDVATICSYVAAIGGEVEIVAKFGPERIALAS